MLGLAFGPVLAASAWAVGAEHILGLVPYRPPVPGLGPSGPWGTVLAGLLVPASALAAPREGQGGVGLLSLAAGVLVTAAYPWSTLDWSLLVLDLGLTLEAVPGFAVLAWGLLPLGVAWLLHVALLARDAGTHYGAKDAPPEEVDEAREAVRRWGLLPAAAGGAGAAVALAGFTWTPPLPSPGPAAAPLLLGAVAVAAVVWALRAAEATGG